MANTAISEQNANNEKAFKAEYEALGKRVDEVIRDDLSHAAKVKEVTIAAVLFAAEHGRPEWLTKLYKGVSSPTAESIRMFFVNLTQKYGGKVNDPTTNKPKLVSFLSYSRDEGFTMPKLVDGSEVQKIAKAMKAAIIKAGPEKLANDKSLPFGRLGSNRDTDMENTFSTAQYLGGVIGRLIREGEISLAKEINRIAGKDGVPSTEIEKKIQAQNPAAIRAAAEKAHKAAMERVKRLEKANSNRQSDGKAEQAQVA